MEKIQRKWMLALLCMMVLLCSTGASTIARADIRGLPTVNVLAASSLTHVMTEIARIYAKRTGITVSVTYGNTSELAERVVEGGEANIFIGDHEESMRQLKQLGLIDVYSLTNIAKNRLVLVAAKGHPVTAISPNEYDAKWWLKKMGKGVAPITLFVIADHNIVPLGKYSQQFLENAGRWKVFQPKLLPANDASHALYMIAKGKNVGMVYASDAIDNEEIRLLSYIDESLHEPIVCQAAVLASESMTYARDFLNFIKTDEAKAVFKRHHFLSF